MADHGARRSATSGRAVWAPRAWALVALVGVVIGAVGAWVWLDRRSARELAAERETMRRAGLLVPLEELMPKPSAPDENAAPLYEKARAAHDGLLSGPGHPDSTGFSGYADGEPAALDDPLLLGTRGGSGRPMPARRVEQVLSDARAQEVLRLLKLGSARPRCVYPVLWPRGSCALPGPSFRGTPTRAVSVVLAQARRLLEAGRAEDAFEWYAVAFAVYGHLATIPSPNVLDRCGRELEKALIAVSAEVSLADPSSAGTDALDHALEALGRAQAGSLVLTSRVDLVRQCGSYEALVEEPAGQYDTLGRMWEGSRLHIAARLYYTPAARPVQRLDYVHYLQAMRTNIELAPLPYREARWRYGRLSARLADRNIQMLGADLFSDGWVCLALSPLYCLRFPVNWRMWAGHQESKAIARDLIRARVGMARTLLVLQRYRAMRGHYPESLVAAEQTMGEEPLLDPFSGGPLGYRRIDGGFRLYSIGPDLEDDGGVVQTDGWAPSNRGDIVLEVPGVVTRQSGMDGGPGGGGTAPPGARPPWASGEAE